jgi:tRNA(fMet)-specific endonuclease VapC
MQYLLDTDTCIDLLRGVASTTGHATLVPPGECAVSTVTSYVLLFGASRCVHPTQERRNVLILIRAITELPFDHQAADHATQIRADLEAKGTPIGACDLQIAGHALAAGLTLVTSNSREFGRVKGLPLQDWRK